MSLTYESIIVLELSTVIIDIMSKIQFVLSNEQSL